MTQGNLNQLYVYGLLFIFSIIDGYIQREEVTMHHGVRKGQQVVSHIAHDQLFENNGRLKRSLYFYKENKEIQTMNWWRNPTDFWVWGSLPNPCSHQNIIPYNSIYEAMRHLQALSSVMLLDLRGSAQRAFHVILAWRSNVVHAKRLS